MNKNTSEVDQLMHLINSVGVDQIKNDGFGTQIIFKNGEVLPLVGGGYDVMFRDISGDTDLREAIKPQLPICDFCGKESQNVISPPHMERPLICDGCVSLAVETFMNNGISLSLNVKLPL